MRWGQTTWWRGCALVVGAVLILSGCGDGEEPDAVPSPPAPSSTSETTPTASPTITPPTLPAEAQSPDVAGAEAFIRYYFDTLNYAYATGELAPMEAVTAAECSACSRVAGIVRDGYANGSHIEDGVVHVGEVTATPGDPIIGMDAVAIVKQDSARVLSSTGDVIEELPKGNERLITFLLTYEAAWSITQWAADAPGN